MLRPVESTSLHGHEGLDSGALVPCRRPLLLSYIVEENPRFTPTSCLQVHPMQQQQQSAAKRSRWDSGAPAPAAAVPVTNAAVEQAATLVAASGPAYEATLRAAAVAGTHPHFQFLLNPSSGEFLHYRSRLQSLHAAAAAAAVVAAHAPGGPQPACTSTQADGDKHSR